MFTFIVIFGNSEGGQLIRMALESLGPVSEEAGGRAVVKSVDGASGGWIASQILSTVEDDYEEEEVEAFKHYFPNPRYALVEGRDGPATIFSSPFVLALSTSHTFLIDNDHGMIADLQVVQQLAQNGTNWLYK